MIFILKTNNMIDCLLIAYNEMKLENYVNTVKQFGCDSGAYRDLRLNYVSYNNQVFDICGIYNSCVNDLGLDKPLSFVDSFSATISYLGSFMHKNDISFDYVQNFQLEKDKISKMLLEDEVHTIAISTTYFVSVFPIVEMIEFIRELNKNVKIIIGGPYVVTQIRTLDDVGLNFLFEHINADVYVYSAQGELTLVELIHTIKQSGSFEKTANIYYRENNEFKFTYSKPESNELSDTPINWELFEDNIDEWINLRTSISCPFNCSFCGSPKYQGSYQLASIDHIEQDLTRLNKIEKLKNVHFIEDTLNVPPKRFKELLRMMIRNKYKFTWHSYFRCQFADRETIELMKESGCEAVYLGLESGCDFILKNMNKSATVDSYLKGIELLKEYKILTHGNFIIGFPGETEETVSRTKQFIQDCGIDFYRLQLWYCMPITPIWDRKDEFDIKGGSFEWEHKTMNSRRAADLLEEIHLTVNDPVWVPQLNFDINGLLHVLHRGMSLENLKKFLSYFNEMVRYNIKTGIENNISEDQYNEIVKLVRTGVGKKVFVN